MTKDMTTVTPITPQEVKDKRFIPIAIIEAVNELITENWNGNCARVYQKDIVKLAQEKDSKLVSSKMFDMNYMDFEKDYEQQGWVVKYHEPGRDDSFGEYFNFTEKK